MRYYWGFSGTYQVEVSVVSSFGVTEGAFSLALDAPSVTHSLLFGQ